MSDAPSRRLKLEEAAQLKRTGGDFVEETRYQSTSLAGFVPWGKTSFRALSEAEIAHAEQEPSPDTEQATASPDEVQPQEVSAPHAVAEHVAPVMMAPPPPPPPPPTPQDSQVSRAEILAEIERAREDGRVLGYHQGVAAAGHELQGAIAILRRIEADLLTSAEESLAKNTAHIARHVRRIAQDLAGSVFATIPDSFLDRIRKTSEMFTRSGMDFSLTINAQDAQVLMTALRGDEVFKSIRIIEDHALPPGGFRLVARDLEVEDTPEIEGGAE